MDMFQNKLGKHGYVPKALSGYGPVLVGFTEHQSNRQSSKDFTD